MMEGIRLGDNAPKEFKAEIREDLSTGDQWYINKDRRVVKMDNDAELERERQQAHPDTPPEDGYPRFGSMLSFGEMPAAPGEVAPEEYLQEQVRAAQGGNAGGQPEVDRPQQQATAAEVAPTPEQQLKRNKDALHARMDALLPQSANTEAQARFREMIEGVSTPEQVLAVGEGVADLEELQNAEVSEGERRMLRARIVSETMTRLEPPAPEPTPSAGPGSPQSPAPEIIRTPSRRLTPEEADAERTRLTQALDAIRGTFPRQAAKIEDRLRRTSTSGGFVAIEEEITESIQPTSPETIRTPEELLEMTKASLLERLAGLTEGRDLSHAELLRTEIENAENLRGLSLPEASITGLEDIMRTGDDIQARLQASIDENQRRYEEQLAIAEGRQPPEGPPPSGGGETPSDTPERPGGPTPLGGGPGDIAFERPGRPQWGDPRNYLGLQVKPIREIFASPREQRLFGEALRTMHPENAVEILARYREHTQTQDDMTLLNSAAREYALWSKYAADVAGRFDTPAELELFTRANRSQILNNLVGHEGPERGKEIIKSAVLALAVRNPRMVWNIRNSFADLDEARATRAYQGWEQEIQGLSAQAGAPVSEFDTAYNLRTPRGVEETTEYLRERIHRSASGFRSAMDRVGIHIGSSRAAAEGLVRQAMRANNPANTRTAEVVERAQRDLAYIAEHLANTVDNEEIRALVGQEAMENRNVATASEAVPQTFEQLQAALADADNSTDAVARRTRERIARNPNWGTWSPERRGQWLNNAVRPGEMRRQRGTGIFAMIIQALFARRVDDGIRTAAGNEAAFAT